MFEKQQVAQGHFTSPGLFEQIFRYLAGSGMTEGGKGDEMKVLAWGGGQTQFWVHV
jgi:hypothetical protein